MDITRSKNIKRFLLGMVFFVSGALSALETLDQQIKKLNEDLIANVKAIESVAGTLPEEAAPQHFLVDGLHSSFDIQAPKILAFINTLMQHKDEAGCKECLDGINSIFYLQAHRFINNLSNEKFATPDKPRGDKDRMLEVLFRTYCSQSIKGSEISYSYEEKPLALLVTEAIISMLWAKNNTRWELAQRQSCLFQTCFVGKVSLSLAINKNGESKNLFVNAQEIEWFIDRLNDVLQKEISPYPWKNLIGTGVKYALIAVVFVGGIYGAYRAMEYLGTWFDKRLDKAQKLAEGPIVKLKDIVDAEAIREIAEHGIGVCLGWGAKPAKKESTHIKTKPMGDDFDPLRKSVYEAKNKKRSKEEGDQINGEDQGGVMSYLQFWNHIPWLNKKNKK